MKISSAAAQHGDAVAIIESSESEMSAAHQRSKW
jgi:hypothetical protein